MTEYHRPEEMVRTDHPARYAFRNWTKQFGCPICGATRWQNTNYLGSGGVVMCNGLKTAAVRVFRDFRALLQKETTP